MSPFAVSRWIDFFAAPALGNGFMERCLVIVSRDRPELVETLNSVLYGPEGSLEIRFDQRYPQLEGWTGEEGERRSALTRDTHLRDHGFMVIPRL